MVSCTRSTCASLDRQDEKSVALPDAPPSQTQAEKESIPLPSVDDRDPRDILHSTAEKAPMENEPGTSRSREPEVPQTEAEPKPEPEPETEVEVEAEAEAKAGPSNEDTGPDTAEGSERKERKTRNVWAVPFYRKSAKNKLLVAAVIEQDPFSAPFGQVRAAWKSVAAALNKEVVFQASRSEHSGCQNQIKKLLD